MCVTAHVFEIAPTYDRQGESIYLRTHDDKGVPSMQVFHELALGHNGFMQARKTCCKSYIDIDMDYALTMHVHMA